MNARWLGVGLVVLVLGLANACAGGKACAADADCGPDGVCYRDFCVDRASLRALGTDAAEMSDVDDGGSAGSDAGSGPDAGVLDNGRG